MKQIDEIKAALGAGAVAEVIAALDEMIAEQPKNDELYYLRGNAYRKLGNWQLAIGNYLEATALNPNSPAVRAKAMLMDILNFYNKDMYNH